MPTDGMKGPHLFTAISRAHQIDIFEITNMNNWLSAIYFCEQWKQTKKYTFFQVDTGILMTLK